MAYFSFSLAVILFSLLFAPCSGEILSDSHPLKQKLDALFSTRITQSKDTLKQAGFKLVVKGHYSDTVVAQHPDIPGYFFKLYTDDQVGINAEEQLMRRIHGANVAKEIIARHGWEHYFKVPQKWLYHLPDSEGSVVLIAEDMELYSRNGNLKKWASKKVKKEMLEILFVFLTEGGFVDSVYPFNIPFSRDGRLAIIDTEKYHAWPIPYHRLTKYLRYDTQVYWVELIN